MATKITKYYLDSNTNSQGKWHPLPVKDLFIRDTGIAGFGVKITPKGTVSFIYENSIKGRGSKRTSLGRYPSLSVSEAKGKALDTSKLYREGIDPREIEREQKREREQELARAIPLKDVLESYFKFRTDKTRKEYTKVINNLYGSWLDLPVRSITEENIAKAYIDKSNEGHRAQAQKGVRYLKAIFNHAMKTKIHGEVILTENPVVIAEALLPKAERAPVPPRDRYIEPDDLFKFIRVVMTSCHSTARDLILLLLFTGLRDSEAKGLKWKDVDFDKKVFTVRNTKGKRDISLPMGSFLYALLLTRYHKADANHEFVFSNPRSTGQIGHIRKQILKVIEKSGIDFSPHDLRRTYATLLEQELGASESIIGRMLNHSPRGVTAKHYLKTKASSYDSLANQLYQWIISDHDWTIDEGKHQITTTWLSNTDPIEAQRKNELIYVLFGSEIQSLLLSHPDKVDMLYLTGNSELIHLFDDMPKEISEKYMGDLVDKAVQSL